MQWTRARRQSWSVKSDECRVKARGLDDSISGKGPGLRVVCVWREESMTVGDRRGSENVCVSE